MEIKIKTNNFEGPLDLLLHLIEKKEMQIKDINISSIINDYLEIIINEKQNNLKIKINFLRLATELIELKAYSILNKEKQLFKEEELENRIVEYKLFKEISRLFSESEKIYSTSHLKFGKKKIESSKIDLDISSLNQRSIFLIFKNLIQKNNSFKEEILYIDLEEQFSVTEANYEINMSLEKTKKINFNFFIKNRYTKTKIVSFFLAILDMMKDGIIDIIQEKNELYILRMEKN